MSEDYYSKLGSKVGKFLQIQILDLQFDHEGADTCHLLHAKYAANEGVLSSLIIFEDTDVMVLFLSNAADISSQISMKGESLIALESYILIRSESL